MAILYSVAGVLAVPTVIRCCIWVARDSVRKEVRGRYPDTDSPFVIKRREPIPAEDLLPITAEFTEDR